jgi:signal peptide peptidase SppA
MSHRTAALAALLNRPLAWERASLEAALDSVRATDSPLQAAGARRSAGRTPNNRVGVLPLVGPITYRPSFWSFIFGGTDLTGFQWQYQEFLDARDVESVVMVCDSPGGEVTGLQETAYKLRQGRQVKPLVAVIDCCAASACYWLASQADEIILTSSSEVGSVGCVVLHVDQSQALEQAGIRPTFIHSGKYKVEANSLEALGDAALQHIQTEVDRVHDLFVADIVTGRKRGLTAERVKKTFGEGRMIYSAEDAIRRGMADRLFPTSDAALNYAVSYASRVAIRADLDYIDSKLLDAGDLSAAYRISDRAAAFHTAAAEGELRVLDAELERQRAADVAYIDAAIRRCERLGREDGLA